MSACQKGVVPCATDLDPVVNLDVRICCITVQALVTILVFHGVAAWKLDIELHLSRSDIAITMQIAEKIRSTMAGARNHLNRRSNQTSSSVGDSRHSSRSAGPNENFNFGDLGSARRFDDLPPPYQ